MRVLRHEFVYRTRKKRASSLEETRNFFAKKDGKKTSQRKNSERCWSEGHPPIRKRGSERVLSGASGAEQEDEIRMERSQLMSGRAASPSWYKFSRLVFTLLLTPLTSTFPVLIFFPPTELRKEKSNSRNIRRKISLRSDDTWPMLKVVGKRTLHLANCIRVFSTK